MWVDLVTGFVLIMVFFFCIQKNWTFYRILLRKYHTLITETPLVFTKTSSSIRILLPNKPCRINHSCIVIFHYTVFPIPGEIILKKKNFRKPIAVCNIMRVANRYHTSNLNMYASLEACRRWNYQFKNNNNCSIGVFN